MTLPFGVDFVALGRTSQIACIAEPVVMLEATSGGRAPSGEDLLRTYSVQMRRSNDEGGKGGSELGR